MFPLCLYKLSNHIVSLTSLMLQLQILSQELRAIKEACSRLKCDPKVTFLVVQKRHHTRFFPMNPGDSQDRNGNVPAGTIVDTEITHPTEIDFYLVSHASIQVLRNFLVFLCFFIS